MRGSALLVVVSLALAMSEVTPAGAQQADLDAIYKRYEEFRSAGNHAAALVEAQKYEAGTKARYGTNHANYAAALYNLGLVYKAQGADADAEGFYRRALVIYEKVRGRDHADVADTLHHLAELSERRGKDEEAERLYKRSLGIKEKLLGHEHAEVATTLHHLALISGRQSKNVEAESFYKRALAIREKVYGPEHADVATVLYNLAGVYKNQGKYAEAEGLYRRALAIEEKEFGRDHADVALTLSELADVCNSQGKYGEAEALYKRLLAIREKTHGREHVEVAKALYSLAVVNKNQGKYEAAEGFYKRTLAIEEKALGREHTDLVSTLNGLAEVCNSQGKYGEAEALSRRALAISEKAHGPEHVDVAKAFYSLAGVYVTQGKYAQAETLFRRALAMEEKALGRDHRDVASSLVSLADVYEKQGKYSEAEALYKRALAIEERSLGRDHPEVATTLNHLALVYKQQGRYPEAEGLNKRALAIQEKALAPDHPSLADTLHELAVVYELQRKYDEAEALYKRTLALTEKALGRDHLSVGRSTSGLAVLYESQRKYSEAEQLYKRALAIQEKALGSDHPEVGQTLNNLANVYEAQARYGDAEELHKRALAIRERALGAAHPDVAQSLSNLALLETARGQTPAALAWSRRATAAVIAHARTDAPGARNTGGAGGLVEYSASYFREHLAGLAAAARKGIEPVPALAREALEIAQWANQSSAAAALQQMGLRFAGAGDALAALMRESQDLAALWRDREKALLAALSQSGTQQNGTAVETMRRQIAETESRLAAVNVRLEKEFPDYASLASPKPLKADEVQQLLGADEALVFWLAGGKETHIFALTRDGFDWKAIPQGVEALEQRVSAFRRGLEVDVLTAARPELFNLDIAHALYGTLIGPVAALIKDKQHLLLVPSGALTALPFHLLVKEKPLVAVPEFRTLNDLAGYRESAWLLKHHAMSVLPSVASLKALRAFAQKGRASKPMIGFGDPVFDPAELKAPAAQRKASRTAAKTRAYTDFWHGAGVDPARISQALPRLEDTADELKAVAQRLGAPARDIHLRAAATETTVKRLPLADYRIIYFATHGLVAGDIKGVAEPSLALSIPAQSSADDDGLLTASEVAQLKLNADWVVLSACNTIAGDRPGAEALSGLARAFFYAGARALLVSHWAVESNAATLLTTSTFDLLKSEPGLGRAEALRRAMLAYMNDAANPRHAYPALWAPFVVVGEGAAR